MTECRDSIDTKEEKKLLSDVASLRERAEFHDVTFVCKDGDEVRANRAFLAVRCEFFDRMLYGELRESTQEVIDLPTVSSSSLNLVLEYLYTCGVSGLRPGTMAVEAYDLARQYNLPGFQRLIVDGLVRHAREGPSNVGEIISTALNLQASDIAERILPVVSSALDEGSVSLFDGFSVDALAFTLSHPQLRAGKPLELVIFKAVLHWALKTYANSCPELDSSSEGGISSALSSLRQVVNELDSTEAKEWRRVLEGVRFDCVPTEVLEQQIEPLHIVPVEFLLKAYRTQASRFSKVALKWSLWDADHRGSEVRIEQEKCEFQSTTHQGARTQTPFSCGVHTWDIHIETYCDLVWVGVVDDTVDMNDWLGKQEGGWMFGSNGTLCHNTRQDNGPYTNKYGEGFKDNAKITVTLDMNKREVSFAVNGKAHPVAFTNLPGKVYPAVSCRLPGLVRVSFGEKLWALGL